MYFQIDKQMDGQMYSHILIPRPLILKVDAFIVSRSLTKLYHLTIDNYFSVVNEWLSEAVMGLRSVDAEHKLLKEH